MKTSTDPRHINRIHIIQDLFSQSFKQQQFKYPETRQIWQLHPKIDNYIQKAATQWPVEKISKMDLAILRLAVYELLLTHKNPPKVIIDEAIEIAKKYGNDNSPAFINGVLGTIISSNNKL